MGPAASFSSNPINCGGGFGCVGGRGWARAGLPPTSTADPDHPLAAGAWSPPTRARKTASLAYRLQAGAGISGRTKHPRHSGGGALAGLAHYMLGWPGGGSRCADAPVYLLHSRTLPSPSQRLPLSWPKVFRRALRTMTSLQIFIYQHSMQTQCHLHCKRSFRTRAPSRCDRSPLFTYSYQLLFTSDRDARRFIGRSARAHSGTCTQASQTCAVVHVGTLSPGRTVFCRGASNPCVRRV